PPAPPPAALAGAGPGGPPPIGGSDANQFPSFTGDGLNDSPIRQLLFLAPVISENVYFEVQPKTGIVGQLAEKDRFGRDENKPAPQQGPLLGFIQPGLEIPSLFRDADFLVVRHPFFLKLTDLIREERMSFI